MPFFGSQSTQFIACDTRGTLRRKDELDLPPLYALDSVCMYELTFAYMQCTSIQCL